MKILATVVASFFLVVFRSPAETTNALSDAEIQGQQLARQLCDARPAESFTNTGVLEIRDGNGSRTNYPVKFAVAVAATNWICIYDATQEPKPDQIISVYMLSITHSEREPNDYVTFSDHGLGATISKTMFPFRHSDFWICDLGLEFFHWPAQKILKHEVRRSRGCAVLESTNPNPATNAYSRVVSWIDNESLGIIHAEAYDAQNKLLKEFDPKSFKKVNGQWELQEMEIRNVQTGSRTRLEFDLKSM